MGHYDSCYESDEKEARKATAKREKETLVKIERALKKHGIAKVLADIINEDTQQYKD